MPNGGQFGAFRRQPRPNRASGAKCLCPARNRRSSIPVIVVKMRSMLRNCTSSHGPLLKRTGPERRLFRQIAQIIVARPLG